MTTHLAPPHEFALLSQARMLVDASAESHALITKAMEYVADAADNRHRPAADSMALAIAATYRAWSRTAELIRQGHEIEVPDDEPVMASLISLSTELRSSLDALSDRFAEIGGA